MSVLFLLIPLSLVLAGLFLWAFIRAVRAGQYEDTCTPGMRVLTNEDSLSGRESGIAPHDDRKTSDSRNSRRQLLRGRP